MTDAPKKPADRSVSRAKFRTPVRCGTLELEMWTQERNGRGQLCEAVPLGLCFSFGESTETLTVVPYSNVVSYDIAK